jgi:ABC-type transport system substrate-binding protein
MSLEKEYKASKRHVQVANQHAECRRTAGRVLRGLLGLVLAAAPTAVAQPSSTIISGGRLVLAQRSEPKTLNPVLALDEPSRALAGMMHASLVRVHSGTHAVEPALAEKWTVSRDGREIVVRLRKGLRFSDGKPLSADDVLFTFQVLQDEKVGSPLRDTLRVGGRPVAVDKVDERSLRFTLAHALCARRANARRHRYFAKASAGVRVP